MRVYLTGFSASGKSTIGKLLAKRMKVRFVDIDARIEKNTRMTIPEIFKVKGERTFRKLEEAEVARVVQSPGRNLVVAVGGGALQNYANRRLIRDDGLTIYLSCSAPEIYRRLKDGTDRPMLDVTPRKCETRVQLRKRRIRELLRQRKTYYNRADLTISTTNRTPAGAASELYRLIGRYDDRA